MPEVLRARFLAEAGAVYDHDMFLADESRTLPAGYVFRAKLILMLAEGVSLARSSNNSKPLRLPSFAG